MKPSLFRYTFAPGVSPDEIEATLLLARMAAEGLHGESRVRLDGGYAFDPSTGTCVIDAATRVGQDLNQLFVEFLRRDQGLAGFRLERLVPELNVAGGPDADPEPAPRIGSRNQNGTSPVSAQSTPSGPERTYRPGSLEGSPAGVP